MCVCVFVCVCVCVCMCVCIHFTLCLSFITDASFIPHELCLAIYYMPPGFTPTVTSHGNSKSNTLFYPTLPSTVECIKKECLSDGPKEVVSTITSEVGGVLDASCPGAMPRNEQQISDYKRRTTGIKKSDDELYAVMVKAHLEDSNHKFVRDIKSFPEPAVLLASDQQLQDVVVFVRMHMNTVC